MADRRTMAELHFAPTEGYVEAIMVPLILAEHFELKHSLINMMTLDQFFGLDKDNPHDHIPVQDSLNFAADGNLLERCTQDVLTIIENKFKVRNSRNKSIVSQMKSSNANSSSSSEIAKLTHAVNQQTSVVTTAMTAILKQFQATPPPASINAEDERAEETLTDPKLIEYTIKVPHPLVQKAKHPNTIANPKGEMKSITTQSGLVLDGPFVPMPHPFINPEEDERA
nr:reverse transcriptase domain-containing protein [Tanacetum cinerariifolium]